MSDAIELSLDGVERQPMRTFTEQAYLNYSMYVIMDRALPHIGDGLKPVQRRIIYAMSELGLSALSKHKKSARTVGDVLGKYHPHGDSACYEAMVLMAQPFSYRYPLVDGQGNWGAPDDPKSFAAMRYTEARLSRFSELLLSELGQGTVEWTPNFDGTMKEPVVLPARLPHILLNGVTGIAVGMATDIPPHNAREVAHACVELLDNPNAGLDALMAHVQGPDYPTNAEIITPRDDIRKIYETGKGSIKQRAVWSEEDGDIVITALPHQASGAKIMEQIAAQMVAKKLPMVTDLRDESDHENPTRLVIVPRSNRVDVEGLMAHLFATTDLEKNYRVNLNILGLDNRPQVKDLKTILTEWLSFRRETVRRRLQYRLDKVLARLHILEGLLIAYLNIDEVIEIIRTEEEPGRVMMERFNISEAQAEAILELKLRHLAKLEEFKLRAEQNELAEERDKLELILGSERRLSTLLKKEILADAEKYGDDRRTPLVERATAVALTEKELTPSEPVTVILSDKGWVRAAKGHDVDVEGLSYKAGDGYLAHAHGRSNQQAVFLSTLGRTYSLEAHTLPSARSQGEPLTGRFALGAGEEVRHLVMGNEGEPYLIASDAGYGFVCKYDDLIGKNKNGKALLTVPEGGIVMAPQKIGAPETDLCMAISNEGRMLLFPLNTLPVLGKGKGNKLISIPSARVKAREEFVVMAAVIPQGQSVTLFAGKRKLTLKPSDLDYYRGERGRRGAKLPRGLQRVDRIEIEVSLAEETNSEEEHVVTKNRDDFPSSVKMDLAGRVGWICSFEGCGKSTAGPAKESKDKSIRNGIAAHITAAAPGGPRYDPSMSPEERRNISNAIWMCPTHGSLIDKEKSAYTVEEIKSWKVLAEKRAAQNLEYSQPINSQDVVRRYSEKDIEILKKYSEVMSYDTILRIKGELFGRFVEHEVTDPLYEIQNMNGNPKFTFQDSDLEKIRQRLSSEVDEFYRHFSQQSAGLIGRYEFVDLSDIERRCPKEVPRMQKYIDDTQALAQKICSTAMELLVIKENN